MSKWIDSEVLDVMAESVMAIADAFLVFTPCLIVIVGIGAGLLGLISLLPG